MKPRSLQTPFCPSKALYLKAVNHGRGYDI
jgi:hypothetical protein